jgi:hypothetical protein
MGVIYTKTDQSSNVSTGTGVPTHSAIAGDRYTNLSNGNTYQYTTSWQQVAYGAGGLTYFTEAQSTASPNATVNVDSLTAIASTTNADFSIVPKGTGAILAAIPDGLGSGGNKRGTNAVDLQTSRVAAAEVASGGYSVLIGGYRTKATGSYSTVAGGQSCTASGDNSFVGGGYNGSASGVYSVTFGFQNQSIGTGALTVGSLNVANGNYDVALGSSNTVTGVTGNGSGALGRSNTVTTGAYSFAIGGYNNIDGYNQYALGYACTLTSNGSTNGTRSVALGNNAHNNGFTRLVYGGVGWVLGDSQTSKVILTQRTTGASATRLVIYPQNTGTASAGNQITPQDNSCYRVKGTIVGKKSGSTDVGVWDIDFVMVRGVGAATTALVGGANVNLVTNLSLWGTPTVTADTTIGCVNISVTGIATTNIQWNCTIESVEVIYA